MEVLLALIGVLALIPALMIYGSFSWGWVLYKLWYWFILPVFPQLPHITFYQAVGMMLFIVLFKNHNNADIKDEYKDGTKWTRMGMAVASPWLTFLCSWMIYLVIR